MYRHLRAFKPVAILTLTTALSVVANSQGAAPTYDPANTTVAILPVINLGTEKDASFKAAQTKAVGDELHKQFADHGFKELDDKAIEDAIASLSLNLTDEEQHNRATILNIGNAAKADLAVFVVINKVYWKRDMGFFTSTKEAHSKISLWLVDLKAKKAILNAKSQESKLGQAEFFRNSVKTSDLIVKACAKAVKDALADTLKPYPVSSDKSRSGSRLSLAELTR